MRVKNPSGIIMRIAVILLCLVLFSAHLASGMFARYTTSASANGGARVAKLDFSRVSSTLDSIDDDGTVHYTVTVNNSSESLFSYDLIITLGRSSNNFNPADFLQSVTIDGYTEAPEVSDDKLTYTFNDAGHIGAADPTQVHQLSIKFYHTIFSSGSANFMRNYQLQFPLTVSLKVAQLD